MLAIIDYQMGNLRSVQKGFEKVSHEATITSDAAEIAAADELLRAFVPSRPAPL